MALILAVEKDLEILNVDVDTAILYSAVKKVIHVDQPDGFEDAWYPNQKCLLCIALCGRRFFQGATDSMRIIKSKECSVHQSHLSSK